MAEPSAAVGSPPYHWPICVLLILLQLANSMRTVQCTEFGQHDGKTMGFGHNMIKGLKLEKLPDMDKVDISNDEFHCKYLEYYRRLYADESEPNDSYDDVSAIQVLGRVKHYGDSGNNEWTTPTPTGNTNGGVDTRATTITFPIGAVTTAVRDGSGSGKLTVVKSVARIHGMAGPVSVYGRLSTGAGTWGKQSLLGEVTWPMADGGRWKDVDVTRLLQPRKRSGGDAMTLEISLQYPAEAVAEAIHFDDDGVRRPVLHVFIDGSVTDSRWTATTCDRDADGAGWRRKRLAPSAEGVHGGKRRRPTSPTRRGFGRTDCKTSAFAALGNGTGNGSTVNKCCRETMRVVFADIDFNFVVEPKWFDAGLCRGRCPFKYNSATQHAYIQSLLWKRHTKGRNRGDGERGQQQRRGRRKLRHGDGGRAPLAKTPQPSPPPKPCCAANKLERLEVLHVDELDPTKLKLSTWEEMVVVECACS